MRGCGTPPPDAPSHADGEGRRAEDDEDPADDVPPLEPERDEQAEGRSRPPRRRGPRG